MLIFLTLAVIALFIWNLKQSDAITDLKFQIKKNQKNTESTPSSTKAKLLKTELKPITKEKKELITPKREFNLEDFFGRKLFAVLGTTSIVLAIGFFAVWAFSTGAVPPMGRIIIGFSFSLIFVVCGEFLRTRFPKFFDKITATGLGGMLVTAYLSRNYDFPDLDQPLMNPFWAFASYSFTVALSTLLSLRYNARFLGSFAVISGLFMPLFVNSDPNPLGLFTYLTVLTVGGSLLALHKKWTEIPVFLLVGILGHSIIMQSISICFSHETEDCLPHSNAISPITQLVFMYGLLFIVGASGIIRNIKDKTVQLMNKINHTDTVEIILFVGAILGANILGYNVFEAKKWQFFGLFVLAQGVGFLGLAQTFKTKKLETFQQISVGVALTALFFATIFELKTEYSFLMTLILAAESLLLAFGAQKIKLPILAFTSRVFLFFAFIFLNQIDSTKQTSFALMTCLGAMAYPLLQKQNETQTILNLIVLALGTLQICLWSFNQINEFIEYDSLLFLIPAIWAVLISYSSLKNKNESYLYAGSVMMFLLSAATWIQFDETKSIDAWALLVVIIAGNSATLKAFFIKHSNFSISQTNKDIIAIITLSIMSLTLISFGFNHLEEPVRTLTWLGWGGLIFALGVTRKWAHFRYFGIGTFLFIISKMYLEDVWRWSTMIRFISFSALGLVLLAISFLYNKKSK